MKKSGSNDKRKKISLAAVCSLSAFVFLLSSAIVWYCAIIPKKYSNIVERYAEEYGLESELIFAVVKCESGFRANARSEAGAVGLMQILPSTAEYISKLNGEEATGDLSDPERNIKTGAAYLRYLFDRYPRLTEALAAYNAGEGRVRSWLCDARFSDDGERLSAIPYSETARYVSRVKKFYNYYKFFYF